MCCGLVDIRQQNHVLPRYQAVLPVSTRSVVHGKPSRRVDLLRSCCSERSEAKHRSVDPLCFTDLHDRHPDFVYITKIYFIWLKLLTVRSEKRRGLALLGVAIIRIHASQVAARLLHRRRRTLPLSSVRSITSGTKQLKVMVTV